MQSTTRFIPFIEPWLDEECAEEVKRQVASGFVGPGKTTEEFSRAIESSLGVSHCVLTTSGTVALTVAAHACGLSPGDEILVPAYGVISTINGFASAGLKPRLVEIDRHTGCIDPSDLERRDYEENKGDLLRQFFGIHGRKSGSRSRPRGCPRNTRDRGRSNRDRPPSRRTLRRNFRNGGDAVV